MVEGRFSPKAGIMEQRTFARDHQATANLAPGKRPPVA